MTFVLQGAPERAATATGQAQIISRIPGLVFTGSLSGAATEADLFPDREVAWPLDTYAPDITGKYDTGPRDMDIMAPFGGITFDQLDALGNSGAHPVDTVVQAHLIPTFFGHFGRRELMLPIEGFPRKAGRIVMRHVAGMEIPTLPLETQAILASLALRPNSDNKYYESARRLREMVADLRRRPNAPRSEFLGLLTKWRLRRLKWVD